MRHTRPNDLFQVDGLDDYLPSHAPPWVRTALRRTAWVVVLRTTAKSLGHAVGVRGADRSQRYSLIAPDHCVVDVIAPEAVAGVRAWPTRDIPALEGFRQVRAPLNHLALPWGPIGSVGFELATGVPTATPNSDLDLVIRLPGLCQSIIDELIRLHDSHFRNVELRVDCQVETPVGGISLTELVSATRPLAPTAPPVARRLAIATGSP
jgi:phosphoribosyl-dephospho-CoA transferase